MCISLVIMFIFHSSFRILLNSYMPASSGRRLVHSSIGRGGLCGAGATRGHRPEGRGQESGAGGRRGEIPRRTSSHEPDRAPVLGGPLEEADHVGGTPTHGQGNRPVPLGVHLEVGLRQIDHAAGPERRGREERGEGRRAHRRRAPVLFYLPEQRLVGCRHRRREEARRDVARFSAGALGVRARLVVAHRVLRLGKAGTGERREEGGAGDKSAHGRVEAAAAFGC